MKKKLVWLALVAMISLLWSCRVEAAPIDLGISWNANTESDIAGYKIYYGTESGVYTSIVDVGNKTSHTISGFTDGTYYIAVTAYDTSRNESGYSNEESKTVDVDTDAPAIPTGTKVIQITIVIGGG